jgi:flagellar basal body-associated protein FliL
MKRTALLLCAVLLAALAASCADDDSYAVFPYNPGEQFITNVSGQARMMLVSTVMIDVLNQKHADTLEEKNYIVRTVIHQFLTEQNHDTLRSTGAMQDLSAQLAVELNRALGFDYIYKVHLQYYTHG